MEILQGRRLTPRRLALYMLASWLIVTHIPSILYASYTSLYRSVDTKTCKALLLIGGGVTEDQAKPIIEALEECTHSNPCVEHLTIWTLARRHRARITVILAHGYRGYLALDTRATIPAIYLTLIYIETGRATIMRIHGNDYLALEWREITGTIDAETLIIVSCTSIPHATTFNDPLQASKHLANLPACKQGRG